MSDKPKRRWYQVSLRTSFILIGLICVALAWVTQERTRLQKRRVAIQRIEAVGGWVHYDWEWEWKRPMGAEPPPSNGFFEWLYADERAGWEVVAVYFKNGEAVPKPEDILLVEQFPHLKILHVEIGTVSEDTLRAISKLKELDDLSLTGVDLSPATIATLAPLRRLTRLRLRVDRLRKDLDADDLTRQLKKTLPKCSFVEYSPYPEARDW